jgi:hypothetical protein
VKRTDLILAASLTVLANSAYAEACQYLTSKFELCTEGTPWANGEWVQGGDSATLIVDGVEYEGFFPYLDHDPALTPSAELDHLARNWGDETKVKTHQRDRLRSDTLAIERVIQTIRFESRQPELRVTMIAEAGDQRILLMVRAPSGTSIDRIDELSRLYAGLVRPAANGG